MIKAAGPAVTVSSGTMAVLPSAMTSFVGTRSTTRSWWSRRRTSATVACGSRPSASRSSTTRYRTPRAMAMSSASFSGAVTTACWWDTKVHTSRTAPSWSWWNRWATARTPTTTSTRSCTPPTASVRWSSASWAAASSACSSSCRRSLTSTRRATPGGAATHRSGDAADAPTSPRRSRPATSSWASGSLRSQRRARSASPIAPPTTSVRERSASPALRPSPRSATTQIISLVRRPRRGSATGCHQTGCARRGGTPPRRRTVRPTVCPKRSECGHPVPDAGTIPAGVGPHLARPGHPACAHLSEEPMRPTWRHRLGLASLTVLALTAAAPTSALGQDPADERPIVGSPEFMAAGDSAPAGGRTITLITGDQVLVAGAGTDSPVVTVLPRADGTVPLVEIRRVGDDVYALPVDAADAIAAGTVDEELFNVTGLVAMGYDDESTATLRVIATYTEDIGTARSAPATPRGATTGKTLRSINAVALRADKAQARRVWLDATSQS